MQENSINPLTLLIPKTASTYLCNYSLNNISFPELINQIKLLTNAINENQPLTEIDLNNFFVFFHDSLKKIKNIGENFFEPLQAHINLILALINRQDLDKKIPVYSYTHSLKEIIQYLYIALTHVKNSQNGNQIDSLINQLLNLTEKSIANTDLIKAEFHRFAELATDLSKVCFISPHCNHQPQLEKIVSLLSVLYANSLTALISHDKNDVYNLLITELDEIQEFIKLTTYLNHQEINAILFNFFNTTSHLNAGIKCEKLLGIEKCHSLQKINFANNTTSIQAIDVKNQTQILDLNDATLHFIKNPYRLVSKITSSAISGVTSGILNGFLQKIEESCITQARAKRCSTLAIGSIKTMFFLANSFSAVALPFFYNYLYSLISILNDTEDSLTTTQLIIASSICFGINFACLVGETLPKNHFLEKTLHLIKPALIFLGLFRLDTLSETLATITVGALSALGGNLIAINCCRIIKPNSFFKDNNNQFELENLAQRYSNGSSDSNNTQNNLAFVNQGFYQAHLPPLIQLQNIDQFKKKIEVLDNIIDQTPLLTSKKKELLKTHLMIIKNHLEDERLKGCNSENREKVLGRIKDNIEDLKKNIETTKIIKPLKIHLIDSINDLKETIPTIFNENVSRGQTLQKLKSAALPPLPSQDKTSYVNVSNVTLFGLNHEYSTIAEGTYYKKLLSGSSGYDRPLPIPTPLYDPVPSTIKPV